MFTDAGFEIITGLLNDSAKREDGHWRVVVFPGYYAQTYSLMVRYSYDWYKEKQILFNGDEEYAGEVCWLAPKIPRNVEMLPSYLDNIEVGREQIVRDLTMIVEDARLDA